jgi:hypothetical protein
MFCDFNLLLSLKRFNTLKKIIKLMRTKITRATQRQPRHLEFHLSRACNHAFVFAVHERLPFRCCFNSTSIQYFLCFRQLRSYEWSSASFSEPFQPFIKALQCSLVLSLKNIHFFQILDKHKTLHFLRSPLCNTKTIIFLWNFVLLRLPRLLIFMNIWFYIFAAT